MHTMGHPHEFPNQSPKVLERQIWKSWQKIKSTEEEREGFGVCWWWCFVGELATALTLSSPIDGQMSPRPLMASVIRSAQRHQHKSMLLRRCSINNKITRAARFLARHRRRRYAAHGKLRALCKKESPSVLCALKASQHRHTASTEASLASVCLMRAAG